MARHSKWANIKHRKSAVDAKRGKVFTKMAKLISVTAAQGGGDLEINPALRLAIQKARAANLPLDNIERAIKKGTGELKEGQAFKETVYEGFGPGGAALLIRCLTDNTNRSFANLRTIMGKNGGVLANSGAVAWMFDRKGILETALPSFSEDLELQLIDAGAEEISFEDSVLKVICPPESFEQCLQVLNTVPVQKSEITLLPKEEKRIDKEDDQEAILELITALHEDDDVDEVFTNATF